MEVKTLSISPTLKEVRKKFLKKGEMGTANLSAIIIFLKISRDSNCEPEVVWEFEEELSFRGND